MKEVKDLKVGDRVYTKGSAGNNFIYIHTIAKITATMIVLKNGNRYRKNDGRSIGTGQWHTEFIYPIDKEIIKEYNIQVLNVKIAGIPSKIKATERNYSKLNDLVNEIYSIE